MLYGGAEIDAARALVRLLGFVGWVGYVCRRVYWTREGPIIAIEMMQVGVMKILDAMSCDAFYPQHFFLFAQRQKVIGAPLEGVFVQTAPAIRS